MCQVFHGENRLPIMTIPLSYPDSSAMRSLIPMRLFFELKDRINKGHYTSKAIDWGTWAARVSKAQIVEFMQSMYGKDVMEENSEHTDSARMTELIVLVKNLDDRQTYALVARES